LTIDLIANSLTPQQDFLVFVVFQKSVGLKNPHRFKRALPLKIKVEGYTKIYFAKNQLYLSLISLSPLITNHLNLFQQIRVQPSNKRYRNIFSLFIIRSLSFGFYKHNFQKPFKTRIVYVYLLKLNLLCL